MEEGDFDATFAANSLASESSIREMESDDKRIRDRIESRRKLLRMQDESDGVKSALCDKIQEEKAKIVGLRERIDALEKTDPELFAFIRKLEYIQSGIWCTTCNKQKNVDNASISLGLSRDQPVPNDVKRMVKDAEEQLVSLLKRFQSTLSEAEELRDQLSAATDRARKIEEEFISFKEKFMPVEQVVEEKIPTRQEKKIEEWMTKKYNLRPTFDLESLIENKYREASEEITLTQGPNLITSDDLLQ